MYNRIKEDVADITELDVILAALNGISHKSNR